MRFLRPKTFERSRGSVFSGRGRERVQFDHVPCSLCQWLLAHLCHCRPQQRSVHSQVVVFALELGWLVGRFPRPEGWHKSGEIRPNDTFNHFVSPHLSRWMPGLELQTLARPPMFGVLHGTPRPLLPTANLGHLLHPCFLSHIFSLVVAEPSSWRLFSRAERPNALPTRRACL